MNKPYYTVRIVLRRSDIGHAIQSRTILKTTSVQAADLVYNQTQGDSPNWDAADEIAHAWDGFSEDDQAVLQQEGMAP